jgi:malic enzyme
MGSNTVHVRKRGYDVLRDPLINKSTAFTAEERTALGLTGLLPSVINDVDQQAKRALAGIRRNESPLEKYVALAALQDRNEYLFYHVLGENLAELMPIVYTPTVGLATQNFSQVFQRGRGVWITPDCRGRVAEVLANASVGRNVELIVATDNESILGIGDQGAGGMAISIGKLALYVIGAGIDPAATLPVSLDVGTDNKALLDDPMYVGWRRPRLRGGEYDLLVDEFVEAVATEFPGALLQWEDFRKDNAQSLLTRHRERILSFNDDIQGTGAVALAGINSALRILGQSLTDQRVLIYGAGAAGLGIARQIKAGLQLHGIDERASKRHLAVMDSRGLLIDDKPFDDSYKTELAWPTSLAENHGLAGAGGKNLVSVIEGFRPTVLIGASGQPKSFTEEVVRTLSRQTPRPVVMPFSNPTDNAEAVPADVLRWTDGKALVATGSPFAPVEINGRSIVVGQGNNVFIFPGLGLGALATQSRSITDAMVAVAAEALAQTVTADELASGSLFPDVSRLNVVSQAVARAVARQAHQDGVAGRSLNEAIASIEGERWSSAYRTCIAV